MQKTTIPEPISKLWIYDCFFYFVFFLGGCTIYIHIHGSESRWRNSQKGGLVRGYDKLRLMGVASHRSFPGGIHFRNTKKTCSWKMMLGNLYEAKASRLVTPNRGGFTVYPTVFVGCSTRSKVRRIWGVASCKMGVLCSRGCYEFGVKWVGLSKFNMTYNPWKVSETQ